MRKYDAAQALRWTAEPSIMKVINQTTGER